MNHPEPTSPDPSDSPARRPPPPGLLPFLRRKLFIALTAVLLGLAGSGGAIILLQDKMVYHPRTYPPGYSLPDKHPYNDHPDLGAQWGILIDPPASEAAALSVGGTGDAAVPVPPRPAFYFYFGGNAELVLGVRDFFAEAASATGCGFLLVEYRGYGLNAGRPTEEGLVQDALAGYDTMKAEGRLENGVGVIGMSLGGGVALALAEQRPVDRVIVVSSFTSVDEMARRTVPWPLWLFCWNDWPSEERIRTMMSRPPGERPAEFHIFHGRRDSLIPFEMGERLAAAAGDAGTFTPLDKAFHNDGFLHAQDRILGIIGRDASLPVAAALP